MLTLRSRRASVTHVKPPRAEIQREVAIHLDTLRELGSEYTETVAASFLDHVEHLIDASVERQLAPMRKQIDRARERRKVMLMSFVFGIPLTGVAGATAGLYGIIVVWLVLLLLIWRA